MKQLPQRQLSLCKPLHLIPLQVLLKLFKKTIKSPTPKFICWGKTFSLVPLASSFASILKKKNNPSPKIHLGFWKYFAPNPKFHQKIWKYFPFRCDSLTLPLQVLLNEILRFLSLYPTLNFPNLSEFFSFLIQFAILFFFNSFSPNALF